MPEIYVVPYIYMNGGYLIVENQRRYSLAIKECGRLGYYFYLTREMLLAELDALTGRKINKATMLYTAVHELRHSWQYAQAEDKDYVYQDRPYYLIDPLEVDADVFASMFMDTLPGYMADQYKEYAAAEFTLDGGLRKARVEELRHIYQDWFRRAG